MSSDRGPLESIDCLLANDTIVAKVIEELESAFGWKGVEPRPLPIPASLTSRKLAVDVGGDLYIVKFVPKYHTDIPAYERRLAVAANVAKVFSGLVTPLPTRSGPYLVSGEAGYFWISPYISSQAYGGSATEAVSAAALLARFHMACAVPGDACALGFRSSQDICLFFIEMIERSAQSPADIEIAARFRQVVRAATVRQPHIADVRILHGDPTIQNFCFREGHAVALCDVDDLERGFVERDVATLIVSVCSLRYAGQTSTLAAFPSATFDDSLARSMLDEFNRAIGLCWPLVGEEFVLLWVEMMCLGIIRGDFPAENVLSVFDQWLGSVARQWDQRGIFRDCYAG